MSSTKGNVPMFDTILACLLAYHRADPSAWVQDDPNEDIEACEASVQRGIDWIVSTPPWNSPEMFVPARRGHARPISTAIGQP